MGDIMSYLETIFTTTYLTTIWLCCADITRRRPSCPQNLNQIDIKHSLGLFLFDGKAGSSR